MILSNLLQTHASLIGPLSKMAGDWWLPKGASTFSPEVRFLWILFFCITVFFTSLIVVLTVFFSIRYRRTENRQHADPSPDHNTPLEITWTVIPLIIVMVIFALGFKYYMNMNVPPTNTYNIGVKAQKWSWTFTYPNHAVSKTLYLPLNRAVKLSMTSADVLHGFWIPSLSIQKDVVPGRVMTIWLEPTRVGRYELQCAEYCGDGHSLMRSPVIVASPAKFAEYLKAAANIWVHNGKTLPLAQVGRELYSTYGCNGCHTADGSMGTGPTWKNLAGNQVQLANGQTVTADYAYLRQAILYPGRKLVKGYGNIMPDFYNDFAGPGHTRNRRLNAMIWYINSLSNKANSASQPKIPNIPGTKAMSAPAAGKAPAKTTAASGGAKSALPAATVAMGEKLYSTLGCNACHTNNGKPGAGPTWKNLAGYPQALTNGKTEVADYKYIRYMILHPDKKVVKGFAPIMPAIYGAQLGGAANQKKLDAIIWYINSLSDKRGPSTEPPTGK